jgi:Na+-transporting NADH:ubiquinone oxidoreductase subunit A
VRRVFGRPFGGAQPLPLTTSLGGRPGAFFPLERLERVVPGRFLIAPLLRALVVGDEDAARALGCLELVEEDLALVSFLCPGKLDYGALLREMLDGIEGRGA